VSRWRPAGEERADTLARVVITDYASVETVFLVVVAVPALIGELWVTVWLLTRGGKAVTRERDRRGSRSPRSV